jgi:hypothetical protein
MTDQKYAPEESHTIAQHTAQIEALPPVSTEPSWYLDDNTPGQGERPDWMPSKYKKASDVGKAYSELEKRLGSFTGAPETYDLSSLEIDSNQHMIKEITAVAKELNMSQEGLQKFLGRISTAQETEAQVHLEEQVKQLGKDGEHMLVEFKNWTKDYLKPEEREVVTEWVRSADDLKAFNRIMAHTHMTSVPTSHTMTMANNFEGVKELRQELTKNIERFENDKTYQKDWSRRMANAVQRNPDS